MLEFHEANIGQKVVSVQEFSALQSFLNFAEKEPIYLCIVKDPLAWDHTTTKSSPTLTFLGMNGSSLDVSFNLKNKLILLKFLENTLLSADKKIMCWNIKSFLTYARSVLGRNFSEESVYHDMYFYYKWLGKKVDKVPSIKEISQIFKSYMIDMKGPYGKLKSNVYDPLSTVVLPDIENNYLINTVQESKVYPYYQIDGQENGRLNSNAQHFRAYNPHHLSSEDKGELVLSDKDDIFITFDFKSMEMYVLSKISEDKKMLSIIESGSDIYSSLWKTITNQEVDPKSRDLAKNVIISTFYGVSSATLSNNTGLAQASISELQARLRKVCIEAFGYLDSKTESAKSEGKAVDVFGRTRYFTQDDYYKAKNYVIQSSSAMICCEFMVRLYNVLDDATKLLFSVYDSYAIQGRKREFYDIYKIVKKELVSESELISGLQLQVDCKVGRFLNKLIPFKGVK